MTTIFEIVVYGLTDYNELENYKSQLKRLLPYKFRILYHKDTDIYEVICRMGLKKVSCGIQTLEKDAQILIRKAMKLAMYGKLLEQYCLNCATKNYYCRHCRNCKVQLEPWGWLVNPIILE